MPKKTETQQNKNKRLVLLDAHAIIHRAYHALPDFATSTGVPTGALYGLTNMIFKIITDLEPDYIIAAYDLPKPTYRHEVYEDYKKGRAKTEDALIVQLEKSKEICEALNIPIYSKEGFEADDILGTVVEILKSEDIDIIIASGDMDTLQLIDKERVKVYTLKKGITDTILYDEKAVISRFGFGPKLLPDYKGLRGDPSDNIVGIAGIGEKTATELINNFGSIESIYKTLKKDQNKFIEAKIKPRIIELLKENEEEAEFSKMLATIRRDAPIDFKLPNKSWVESIDTDRAKKLFTQLEFRTMSARLDQVIKGRSGIEKSEGVNKEQSSLNEANNSIPRDELLETEVALWVVDSNKTDPNIDDILNFANTNDFEKAKKIIFDELKKREVESVFEDIEKPLIPILEKMSEHGVYIDRDFFTELDKKYNDELRGIEKNIWKEAGQEFNVSSPKQLSHILFDVLNLSIKNHKKTGGGAKSTKESELEKMKDLHPIIPQILEYRELSKLIGTYIEPIPKLLDEGNRLHARFIQTGSTTGRMASHNPNLQNIPISSERGRAIRKAFIAPKKRKLIAFDYSQIELRIAAFLSNDEKLIEIFKTGEDIHTSVASIMFSIPREEVTKEMRRKAKVINFGILYGMGVNALKENLHSDRKEAQSFYDAYFEKFPTLANYLDEVKKDANQKGYTKTFFGRRRYFEGIKSKIPFIRAAAERMAINAPIQGTQADIVKLSMIKIDKWLKEEGIIEKVNLILQIHDELIYEVEEDLVEKVIPKIKEIMEGIMNIEQTKGVPIIANSVVGNNWGEME